jgi:hypothetical protein
MAEHVDRRVLRCPHQIVMAVAVAIVVASCSTATRPSASIAPSATLSSSTLRSAAASPAAEPPATAVPPESTGSASAVPPGSTGSARGSIATDRPSASGPPLAQLAAEGGDPTAGQLGTYTWGDGGSDAPWLPGARISVGSGEPLTVTFTPTARVGSWRARTVPSTSDGPAGAIVLGQGSGTPRFEAPEPGTWTVEVGVVFAKGDGTASYFWQLAVD